MKKIFTVLLGIFVVANVVAQTYYFSVSDSTRVIFSPGNLQYNAMEGSHLCADGTTKQGTWRFAEHQWDMIGDDNANISETYDGWIDLFAWGTSGWNSGANEYQPYSTSTENNDYYPGGIYTNNIVDEYANGDWGRYNVISNGGNSTGLWRTLTNAEWTYLIRTRTGAASKKGLASVNGIDGLILIPDEWTMPNGIAFTSGTSGGFGNNTYSIDDWSKLENNGAVFLPAAGVKGKSDNTGSFGSYWSSTSYDNTSSYFLDFGYTRLGMVYTVTTINTSRSYGLSVRLVKDDAFNVLDVPDMTINEDEDILPINLLDYCVSKEDVSYSYDVYSSDVSVVYPVVMSDQLGFIKYGIGTATIYLYVTVNESTIMKPFKVTVNAIKPIQPCTLEITSEITSAICNGVADGKIEVSVSGGAEPYYYKWSTGRTSSGIYNVRAGSYSVLVVDSLGCTATETFFVSEPSAVAVYEEITNPACGQNNGSISLRVFGGTEPYLYAWEGSTQTTSTIENLSADNYTVTVTDGNYCTVTKTFSLTEIGAPIVASPIVTPSKCNEPLGSVQIAVSGGTGEQTFEWNDSTKVANNLFRPRMYAGDYKLKVTDGNNCHATMYVTVPQIPFKQPEIALVSYGDTARHNLVVWQKENTNDIDYYNIYRETEYGNYEKIGTSAYKETSIFIDETADFKTKSSRYRLSASNKCWESPLSKEYKTILLQWKKNGNGSLDLWWDAYEGCEYVKYSILRLTRNGIDKFKDIPANKVRYTIDNVEEGTIGFFISVELISQVDVTKPMKSESGPFIIVVSNIAELENRDAVDDIAENQVLAFGGDKSIFVNNANGEDVSVCDLTGKTIVRKQNVDSTTIPVKTAGVYIVIVGDRAFKVVVRE